MNIHPMATPFHSIEEAIRDIKQGKFVILVDDEDRENKAISSWPRNT